MRRQIGLACTLGALLIAAPIALGAAQSAASVKVSASFTYKGRQFHYTHERLTISRGGQVVYNQPVTSKNCFPTCAPGSLVAGHPSLQIADIEHNGDPDIILTLFSQGANCCLIDQIFSFDPSTTTYVKTERNFATAGANITDLSHNGRLEFVSSDPVFQGAFTDDVASGLPLQILTFSNRHFTPVTSSYPTLVTKDAAQWLKLFKRHLSDGVGLIAAWAGDEDLLGHSATVKRYLAKELKAGNLRSALGANLGGQKFINHLQKFLRRYGYLK
jgi:hypothetical protein